MTLHLIIRLLMLLVFLSAIGDYFSTQLALSAPGVSEANPVEAWFQRVIGPAWVVPRLLFALVQIAVGLLYADNQWQLAFVFALGTLVGAYAIWNNLTIWLKNRVNSV